MRGMTGWVRQAVRALPALAMSAALAGAQGAEVDPAARLREVLPADVAERVIARVEAARSRNLPPEAVRALENRALKFAARDVRPADIERAIGEHAERMVRARDAIEAARQQRARGDEVEAGAEAMRLGVDGAAVSELARSAPSGRSLAVPLYVIGSLLERGLPADEALARVHERLVARASDREIEGIAGPPDGRGRPAGVGPGLAPADRPGTTGRPENVPATGGRPTLPTTPGRPETPGRPPGTPGPRNP